MTHSEKVKKYLEEHLKREATENEIINANNDVNLLVKILFEEVEQIKKKLNL